MKRLPGKLYLISLLLAAACSDDSAPGDAAPGDGGGPDQGPAVEDTKQLCQDGKDNDGDKFIDCKDQDCWAFAFCQNNDSGPRDGTPLEGQPADLPLVDNAAAVDQQPDAPAADQAATPDKAVTADQALKPDASVKAALPGCPAGCLRSEVCMANKCVKIGPTKGCGAGPWQPGLGSNTVYVNGAHAGPSSGTAAQPFKTINAALAALKSNQKVIAVAAGIYVEDLFVDRDLDLRCRCPSKVTIAGSVEVRHLSPKNREVTIDGCRVVAPDSLPKPKVWGACSDSTQNELSALWGTGVGDVMVASVKGEVLRHDGLRWKASTTGASGAIQAGWGASAKAHFAVGAAGLVLRFDGSKWSKQATGTNKDLRGVWGRAASEVYAVGQAGTVLRFNGISWTPEPSGTPQDLRAAWGTAAGEVLVVGAAGTVLRRVAGKWSTTKVSTRTFNGVWGSSASDVYAVGDQGTIARFDGKTWTLVPTPMKNHLHGVWGSSPTDVWAVGDLGALLHFDGKQWTNQTTGFSVDLAGVWGNAADSVYAVGKQGTILHYNGKVWRHRSAGTPAGLHAISGAGQLQLLVLDSEIGGWCKGVYFSTPPSSLSSLCLSRTRIYANSTGVEIQNAPTVNMATSGECSAIPEAVGSRLSLVEENRDFGIYARAGAQGVGLQSNIVERSGRLGAKKSGTLGYGVYLGNVESAHLSSNVIRDNENRGLGMRNLSALQANVISIDSNAVQANGGAGIALQQLQATKPVSINGNWLTGTRVITGEPGGDGLQVSVDKGKSYTVTVTNNKVNTSKRNGVFLDGVGGAVTGNEVTGNGKHGVLLQQSTAKESKNNFGKGNGVSNVTKTVGGAEQYSGVPVPLV